MTKTETQIAQELIKEFEDNKKEFDSDDYSHCSLHKATCQRFLEFLKKETEPKIIGLMSKGVLDKITDLKNAIKVYEDAGI